MHSIYSINDHKMHETSGPSTTRMNINPEPRFRTNFERKINIFFKLQSKVCRRKSQLFERWAGDEVRRKVDRGLGGRIRRQEGGT